MGVERSEPNTPPFRNRERTAGHLFNSQLLIARLEAEISDRRFDIGDAHKVRIAKHRNDQTIFGRDGNTNILVSVINTSLPSIDALTSGYRLSASQQALTKNPIKPNRVPLWVFSNWSLYCDRNAISGDISTSLNVVSIAVCCVAERSRSAIRARMRVIGTRRSMRSLVGPWTSVDVVVAA